MITIQWRIHRNIERYNKKFINKNKKKFTLFFTNELTREVQTKIWM